MEHATEQMRNNVVEFQKYARTAMKTARAGVQKESKAELEQLRKAYAVLETRLVCAEKGIAELRSGESSWQ